MRGKQMNKIMKSIMLGGLTASILASAGASVSVEAAEVNYFSDLESAQNVTGAKLSILPMGQGATNNKVLGGAYTIKQVKAFNPLGELVDVEGTEEYVAIDGVNPETGEYEAHPSIVTFTGEGIYEYQNTERVPGYYLDQKVYTVEIPGTGNFDFSGTEAEGFANNNGMDWVDFIPGISSNDGTNVFTFPKLNLVTGEIRFTKTDPQGTPLAGAQFKLEQLTDVRVSNTDEYIVREVITDDSGIVLFTDLPEGTYRVTELTAPENFAQAMTPQVFSVGVDETGLNQVTEEITEFYDDLINEENNFINFKEITVNTKLSTNYGDRNIYSANGSLGVVHTVDLPENINTYEYFNINATLPEEFYLNIPEGAFQIMTDTGVEVNYIQEQMGQEMKIKFTPLELQTLTGAKTLQIFYPIEVNKTNVKPEMTSQFEYDVQWSNARGAISNEKRFATVVYKEGIIDMVVSDGNVGTAVAGAEFQLYALDVFLTATQDPDTYEGDSIYEDGQFYTPATNPITGENYRGVSDSGGNLTFRNLPFGEYKVVQTVTPTGYRQNKTTMDVAVDDTELSREDDLGNIEHDIVTVNVQNYKGAEIFPGTGTNGNILTITIATAMVVGAVGIGYKKKREGAEQQ